MPTTYGPNKLPSAVADNNLDVGIIEQPKLKLLRSASTNDKAVYNYEYGDVSLPAQVVSRIDRVQGPKILIPTFQWNVSFETSMLETLDTGTINMVGPAAWGVWVKAPIRYRMTAAEMSRGFGSVIGLVGSGISAGVMNLDRMSSVLSSIDAYVF